MVYRTLSFHQKDKLSPPGSPKIMHETGLMLCAFSPIKDNRVIWFIFLLSHGGTFYSLNNWFWNLYEVYIVFLEMKMIFVKNFIDELKPKDLQKHISKSRYGIKTLYIGLYNTFPPQ